MNPIVPIAFSVGSYGTYLEWVLTTLCATDPIQPPFTGTGSSHDFIGNHLEDMAGWQRYLDSGDQFAFGRLHPKTHSYDSLSHNLDQICQQVAAMIHLYPGEHSQLLVINNWLSKVKKDWWQIDFGNHHQQQLIYDNWPDARDLPFDQIPEWVRREFLSLYLPAAWHAQVEWYHPRSWHNHKCLVITVDDLLADLAGCVEKIVDHTGISLARPVEEILPYHAIMVDLQRYRTQDWLAQHIVDQTLAGNQFDWQDQAMPLATQAWIQHSLRKQGWEIQCHGLDKWPTNSVALASLLYSRP